MMGLEPTTRSAPYSVGTPLALMGKVSLVKVQRSEIHLSEQITPLN
jgi:hypothetical protein